MSNPADCRYTETHEWVRVDGDVVTVGLTQHAADELTDVTFVEMHAAGSAVTPGESMGEVESVKATSDVYSPVPGEIIEVNDALESDPSVVNSDPYAAGWLVKIKASDTGPIDALMDAATYTEKYPA